LVLLVSLVKTGWEFTSVALGETSVNPHSKTLADFVREPGCAWSNALGDAPLVIGTAWFCRLTTALLSRANIGEVVSYPALLRESQLKFLRKNLNTLLVGACSAPSGISWTGGTANSWYL